MDPSTSSTEGTRRSFEFDTKGHCFICLNKREISSTSSINFATFCKNLQIDMMSCVRSQLKAPALSVFTNSSADQESNVAVELCRPCERAIERFCDLIEEVKKFQKEMVYCVGKIKAWIKEGEEDVELHDSFRESMSEDLTSLGLRGIINQARKEVLNKCSTAQFPSILFPQFKFETCYQPVNSACPSKDSIPPVIDLDLDELLFPSQQETNQRPDFPANDNDDETSETMYPFDKNSGKFKCREPSCPKLFKTRETQYAHCRQEHAHTIRKRKTSVRRTGWVRGHAGLKGTKYVLDKKTGKYKCFESKCLSQFSTRQAAHIHFKALHLNIRYTCEYCKMDFTTDWYLKNHSKNCHSRPKKITGILKKRLANTSEPLVPSDPLPPKKRIRFAEDTRFSPVLNKESSSAVVNQETEESVTSPEDSGEATGPSICPQRKCTRSVSASLKNLPQPS